LLQVFCHESSSPKLLKITLGTLRDIRDIRKSMCTTGVNCNGGKFATGITGVVDTGGKFATCVNVTSGKLPQVSTTLAISLPPVSTTMVANNGNNITLLTT
jgi:hypothetical protein